MAKHKPILIGCPQYHKLVRGKYECGDDGRYLLAPDGTFALQRVMCGQYGGRCMQTLCALHRFNRRHAATWFPSEILAADDPAPARTRKPAPKPARTDGQVDFLC